jgi:ABC-type phosphate/phosphonate transport system substrate-binding protein
MLYDAGMIATLPMYDWPEVRSATDAWWEGLSRHMGAEVALLRSDDYAATWLRDDLLFSQTCGYPFTHGLTGKVKLVATPHYAVDGCDGAFYQSIVFARKHAPPQGFRGATAAVNTPDSMSGMLAMKLVFAPHAEQGHFFGKVIETGGHLRSIDAVREGRADVCAVDAVCVGLARAYRPDCLKGLVEIARSPMVPGLPFITRSGDPAQLRQTLARAFADPKLAAVRNQLFLSGFSVMEPGDYMRITRLEAEMEASGGLNLL